MANGSAALQLLPPAVPAAGAPTPGEGVEIGEAVASAVIAIAQAIDGYRQDSVLVQAAKDEGARRIARVAGLALDYEFGDEDFLRTAHTAGRRVLRQYFSDGHDPVEADAAIGIHIDTLLGIVSAVVRDERILRRAWAN